MRTGATPLPIPLRWWQKSSRAPIDADTRQDQIPLMGIVLLALVGLVLGLMLLRFLLRGLVPGTAGALLIGVIVAAIASQSGGVGPVLAGSAATALAWPFTVLIAARRAHLERRASGAVRIALAPPLSPEDERLARAWRTAGQGAGRRTAEVEAARVACERLLERADASGEPVLVDWAVVIRRRVPELVEAAFAAARLALAAERGAIHADLVASLRSIGAEADARVMPAALETRGRFDLLRRHIANRTGAGHAV